MQEPTKLKETIDINLTSVLNFSRIALAYMKASKSTSSVEELPRSIILVSSIAGITEAPGLFAYSSAKHGVIGLMRALRPWAPLKYGVRVNAICPWATDTQPPSPLELETLARSLGACGSEEAERVLRSWINPSAPGGLAGLGEAAAWGLGALADRTGRLEERTLTVLLDAAEHEKSTLYLYPLGRLPQLSEALAARTLDVAGTLVVAPEQTARGLGVLALGSSGHSAALPLAQLILKTEFAGAERALAVQALSRL